MRPFRTVSVGILLATATTASAQTRPAQGGPLPPDSIALTGLAAFRPTAGNWRVAGGALADRAREQRLTAEPGTGVLVNLPTSRDRGHLMTTWEHADLDLELDFMVPRGSNSGVYLMGRYEVQILDSWGVRNPTFSDAGGIYQRWDPARGSGREGFEGVPPRINASRAPGIWQTLRVRFRAPRFDAQGRKVENARFVRVELNGSVIHENVEVTGPTRSAAFEDEKPTGPLMIQGDHGPIALRNIRFKRYSGERVRFSDLRFRAWEGPTGEQAYAMAGAPRAEGPAEGIATSLAGVDDKFAMQFQGNVEVPTSGRYRFELIFDWVDNDPHFTGAVMGGGQLSVGGRQVLTHSGRAPGQVGEIELTAGLHPFNLTFYKNRPWTNRTGAQLYVEGPEVERHALHVTRATPVRIPGAIHVAPQGEVTVLRSFVRHRDTKRTHVASVGDPAGVHFSYDLSQGGLLHVWRGPFMEATPMWNERGNDQLALPLGSVLTLSGEPTLAVLADASAAWPDSAAAGAEYRFQGYELDDAGRPTFLYTLGGVAVEDRLRPADDGVSLSREIRLRGEAGGTVYARIAEGKQIRALRDGSFVVEDAGYYVVPARGTPRPVLRPTQGGHELLVPVRLRGGEADLSYTITW